MCTEFARRLPLALVIAALLGAGTTRGAPAGEAASLEVDAREAPRGIMTAHLELPVVAGPLTLVYPKWLPGRSSHFPGRAAPDGGRSAVGVAPRPRRLQCISCRDPGGRDAARRGS